MAKSTAKKRITVSSAKAKGRELQQQVAALVGELLGMEWGYDTHIAPREMGQSGTDVRLIGEALKRFPFSVECKRCESWSVPAWIEQAKKNQLPNTHWLLVAKRNHKDAVVILDMKTFFSLLKRIERLKESVNKNIEREGR